MDTAPPAAEAPLLVEGATAWKIARAGRATLLIDGAAFFGALRQALACARRSVFILGWDIDSRTPLMGEGGADDGAPETLLAYLEHLVRRSPELEIRLLLWDYSLLYALDREPLPSLNLRWRTPEQVKVALDNCLPLGACHHQKLVVVDGCLAFCGGFDLTTGRWDTREHRPDDPRRVNAKGKPYEPWHDVQMMLDGDAAGVLFEIARQRWKQVTSEDVKRPRVAPAWPEAIEADFRDVDVGIARTLPGVDNQPAVTEIRESYLASIRAAHRWIYVENQYLTADAIADALIERMREQPSLELVAVTPRSPHGWLEAHTMGTGQQRFRDRLAAAGLASRVRFYYPWVGDRERHVMVHAKVMIVDDRVLHVGSSNLNNRSMGVDSECDVIIEARDDEQRRVVHDILCGLLGEHLGMEPARVAAALARAGSLAAVIEEAGGDARGLAELPSRHTTREAIGEALNVVADPERPLRPEEFIGDMFDAQTRRADVVRLLKLGGVAVALLAVVLAWSWTPLASWADPEVLVPALSRARGQWWIYPLLLVAYVLGGLLLFPLTVLLAVTGMVLGPVAGFVTALACGLASAWTGYVVGRWAGAESIRNISGRAFRTIRHGLRQHGVITVAAVRMVPVAPFTVVNMAMGAAGVGMRAYLAGTAIGLVPGVLVLTMVGDRLREVWRSPDPLNVLWFALVAVLWLGLAFVLQRVVARLRRPKTD